MVPNPSGKARIVARIRRESYKESENFDGVSVSVSKQPWISIARPDDKLNPNLSCKVKISFGSDHVTSGKQSYEVDECYEQDVGTEEIFSREIKPLISGLFAGQNSTVFAYGPPSSGKTYTFQGSEEELGLLALTLDSVLPQAEEKGKIITVSIFEVQQERVIDILDSKRSEVSVFEDGQGKIRLKGLSKVKVNSTSEFHRLYYGATNAHKPFHRSHIGCIVHVVSPQTENSNAQLVGKINFVDLASYEDSRRKSIDNSNLAETTRINKSLYAVHNVLYALNANEARVPYRESKLTRVLQDSLGGANKVLMITCMGPGFCQETVQTISLASRSCQAGFLACLDPGKSSRSATKTNAMYSPQVKPASKFSARTNMLSPKIMKPMSASASGKKQGGSLLRTSMRKPSGMQNEVKGRKLFDETSQSKHSKQRNICPESAPAMESSAQTEKKVSLESELALGSSNLKEENSAPKSDSDKDFSQPPPEEEKSLLIVVSDRESSQLPPEEDVVQVENKIDATPITYQTPTTGCSLLEDKENKSLLLNDGASPPLSARIRELSNSLKSLCVSTESSLKMAQDSSILRNQVINETFEPKTPIFQPCGSDDKHELSNIASPWSNFHIRGSGMKDSLVQEYLKFLNSANKEELKGIKGIGEKRATYILEMREESPEPFKKLDDLREIGLSEKQIKGMLKNVAGDLFT